MMTFDEFKNFDVHLPVSKMCDIAAEIMVRANAVSNPASETDIQRMRNEYSDGMARLLYATHSLYVTPLKAGGTPTSSLVAESSSSDTFSSSSDASSASSDASDNEDNRVADAITQLAGKTWSLKLTVKDNKKE